MNSFAQTICLCMIVKNETPVIARCLRSVRPLIDRWLVVDTGSTDGTQAIVRAALSDLPGELIERPWRDFAHNRSEALDLARPLADYTLIIDADDEFIVPPSYRIPPLRADSYVVPISDGAIAYRRTQLVSNRLPWAYRGVLHEFLSCPEAQSVGYLPVTMRRNHDGRRRRDPATYKNDSALLAQALAIETDPFLVSRYTFYLAQSYRDCGQRDDALTHYLRRAELGFWDQEVFISLLEAARLMEALGRDPDETLATYSRASESCPTRAEAAHGAARLCRILGRYEQGFAIAEAKLGLTLPEDALFVEPWIYSFGLLDEYAVHASWTGRHLVSLTTCLQLEGVAELPESDRARIMGNARFAVDRLREAQSTAATIRSVDDAPWQPSRAQGGTELMVEGLRRRLGSALDRIDLRVNGLGEIPVNNERPLVVWLHHDIDQLAVQWLNDTSEVAKVDRFVFVSSWQRARYVSHFGLPAERCTVLLNATDVDHTDPPRRRHTPLKIAYTSTPSRGLSVLLDAWDLLRPERAELHIWSSLRLYGPGFDDETHTALFEKARGLPRVHVHGIVPNAVLKERLRDCDILAYPSTFQETSCLAAIDAMAAGCRVVCPDYGALSETVGQFGRVYPHVADPQEHAKLFADILREEISVPWAGNPATPLQQHEWVKGVYAWAFRIPQWMALIDELAAAPAHSLIATGGDRTESALIRLRECGFSPRGILDLGAFEGEFALVARRIFPGSRIMMVDALPEQASTLGEVADAIGNAEYRIAVLGDRDLEAVSFFVVDTIKHPNLVKTGSSKHRENTGFPMVERRVAQHRLEALLSDTSTEFDLIKLDLQGAEISALKGLGARLESVDVILTELSLVDYNAGAPALDAAFQEFAAMGFVLLDILKEHRNGSQGLLQIDGIFVRTNSRFRPQPPFWT